MNKLRKLPLSELIELRSEQIIPNPKVELNYVGLEHIKSSRFILEEFSSSTEVKSSKFKFYPTDILYGKLRPYLDKTVLSDIEGICSTDIYVFRAKNQIYPKYLLSLLHSKPFRDFVDSTTVGMNLPRTSWIKIKDFCLLIPYKNNKPNLKEQKRIADKIDKLFAEINKGIEKTKGALENAESLLQSELKKIFSHKLKKNWRLIKFGGLVLPNYGLKRGPWGGSIKKSFFVPKGYKVYEQGNVISNDFRNGNYFIDKSKFNELKGFEIKPGDLLITGAGTIGRIAVVPNDIKRGVMNQALLRVRIDENKITKQYFVYFFQFISNALLQGKYTKGSGLKNLVAVRELKKLLIPLPFGNNKPNLREQKKIVKRLDKIQEQSQKLQAKCEEQLKYFEMLKQSILNQAFQGKL